MTRAHTGSPVKSGMRYEPYWESHVIIQHLHKYDA